MKITLYLRCAAGALLLTLSGLLADEASLTPVLDSTTGLTGSQQTRVTWPAQPGVFYRVEKSTSLGGGGGGGGGWSTRALVEGGEWLDPEPPGTRAFYRVPEPQPELFAISPAVLSPGGTMLTLEGQCLPAGSSLEFTVGNDPPVVVAIMPGPGGQYRAMVPAGAFVSGAHITRVRVVGPLGNTVLIYGGQVEVTATGRASEPPPEEPAVMRAAVLKTKIKSNQSNDRHAGGGGGGAGKASFSDLSFMALGGGGMGKYMGGIDYNSSRSNKTSGIAFSGGGGGGAGKVSFSDLSFMAWGGGGMGKYMGGIDYNSSRSNKTSGIALGGGGGGAGKVSFSDLSFMAWGGGGMGKYMGGIDYNSSRSNKTSGIAFSGGGGGGAGKASFSDLSFSGFTGSIRIATGDFHVETPAGPSLVWGRTYASRTGGGTVTSDPLGLYCGAGWSAWWSVRIEPVPAVEGVNAPRLYLHSGDGRRDVLYRQADGTYRSDGMFREGQFHADTSFTLTFADQTRMIFCPLVGAPWRGRLGSLVDASGVALSCTYNAAGQLQTVSSQFGQSFTCAYDPAGQLVSVTDHTGRFVAYEYYAAGEPGGSQRDLKSVSCVQSQGQPPLAGPETYTYTTGNPDEALNHNLLTARDGAGRMKVELGWKSQTNPQEVDYDACEHFTTLDGQYFMSYTPLPGTAGVRVYVNDGSGRVSACDFDPHHRCVRMEEFTGFTTPGAPYVVGLPLIGKLRQSDPDSYVTAVRYNADHGVTRVTHPDGAQERTVYGRELRRDCPVRERGNAHLVTLRTSGGEERTVTMEYLTGFGTFESGRPGTITCRKAGGKEEPYTFVRKQGKDQEDYYYSAPAGGAKAKAWMVNNYEVHPVFGLKTEWITSIGLPKITPKISKESHGKYSEGSGGGWAGEWPRCRCTAMITSHGQVFTWSYDAHGNLTASRPPVAGSGCDYSYNTLGQCTSETVLNGPGSRFVTQFTHDAAGWPTGSVVDPDINGDGTALQITTTCERDPLGRIARIVDPRGFDTLYAYDEMDRVTVQQSPRMGVNGGMPNRISMNIYYDRGGAPARADIEHRDAASVLDAANPHYSVFVVYDNRGRVIRTASEQRPVQVPAVPSLLDPAPLGLANFDVTDFTYNDAGECVRVSTPAESRGQSKDAVCDYQYDERGGIYREAQGGFGVAGSVTIQTDYTPAGMVSRRMLLPTLPPPPPFAPDPEIVYTYDGFHRLASVTDPMGNVTQYQYDDRGFVTVSVMGEVNDVPGSAGNMLLARGSGRRSLSYHYYMWSSAKGINSPNLLLNVRGSWRPAFFDVFTADDVWTEERFAPGTPQPHPVETTTVRRSPAGLVTSVENTGDTVFTCTYDTAGRAAITGDGAKTVHAVFRDRAGNVTACTRTDHLVAGGGPGSEPFTHTFIWDSRSQCVSSSDNGGNNENWDFDSLGRLTQYTDPRGTVWRGRWDGEYSDGTVGVPPRPYTFLMECDSDGDGDMEMLCYALYWGKEQLECGNSNNYRTTYTYDPAGRLVQCDYPDGTRETWSTDNYGRTNTMVHKDGTITVADLDRDGRPDLVTVSGAQGAVPVDPVDCRYNGLGQCMGMDQGDSHLVFTYDSLGNQLSESHNGLTITRTFNHRGRTAIWAPSSACFVETRDELGLLLSKSAVNAAGVTLSPPVTVMEYTGQRVTSETRANGVVTTHDYRSDGEPPLAGNTDDFSFDECVRTVCRDAVGNVIYSTRVRRDPAQNVTQCETFFAGGAQAPGRRHVQGFDRMGRLNQSIIQRREVAGGPFDLESLVTYALDFEGRRLSESDGITLGLYAQNPLVPPGDHQMGQYSSWPGGPLEWDDQGCLTFMSSSAGIKQFIHDASSRLVAVNDIATGQALATYAYDAAGRRTRSTVAGSDPLVPPVTTFFVYDGADCVQELGGDGLPNITMATHAGLAICIISRNGTLVYPHGGGSKVVVAGSNSLSTTSTFAYGPPDDDGDPILAGVAIPKFLDYMKKGKAAESGSRVFADPTGVPTERTDCDHAGAPVFLTSDGTIRQGATGTLSGYDWFPSRRGYGVNTRSDTYLSCDRYCRESGFFQGHRGVYSPQLGLDVSTHKEKPKPKPVVKCHELTGHVTLIK